MTNLNFTPAVRHEAKARVAIIGPTGAGKTWTALQWATALGERIGVIDTENGSASLYSDAFQFNTAPWSPPYDATKLAAAIRTAAGQFDVLIVDSLTHFWQGAGGVLDQVERAAERARGNQFAGWKVGTPIWRELLDSLIFAPCHVIVTMRSKMDYVQTERDGRKVVEKLGMAPVARNDVEYEFTVVGELDQQHRMSITKSRCSALADAVAAPHQAGTLAETLRDWLSTANPDAAPARPEPAPLEQDDADKPTQAMTRRAMALFSEHNLSDRDDRLSFVRSVTGRDVQSWNDVTRAEASQVIDALTSDGAS